MTTEPKRIDNWDDSWTGWDYGTDVRAAIGDAKGMMDHLNLPIKILWMDDGGRGLLTFYRLMPRHGNLAVIVAEGATPDDFRKLARAVRRFYGPEAGETKTYRYKGKVSELYWNLGRER